jgi:hypothetical protein
MMDEVTLRDAIASIQNLVLDGDEVRVNTHCLYPSNSIVRVAIRGGIQSFVVSDMAGAVREAASVGLNVSLSDLTIKNMVAKQGLLVSSGEIASPAVPLAGLASAIMLVANASKEVAGWCFNTYKTKPSRNFKALLNEMMERSFSEDVLKHGYHVVGKSTKTHKFEYAIPSGEHIILVDSAVPDANSINSRVVANLDVKQNDDPRYEQFIIYDDEADWSPSDLTLLGLAASIVPFSMAPSKALTWQHH